MRAMIMIVLGLALAGAATAQNLGPQAPAKTPQAYPENVPNPVLQGGDTIATATVIPSLPYTDSGTTAGYVDNYQASCFYASGAPDVVYRYTAMGTFDLGITLCGSTFDTGLYVYDAAMHEIACNDDYCGLQSQVDRVPMVAGETYYIVVDGYGNASGAYMLSIMVFTGPDIWCPPGGSDEGEPPLVDDYVDAYNGGCNTPPAYPFQDIPGDAAGEAIFCGVSGWYTSQGSQYRDTDWFRLFVGATGSIEISGGANVRSYLFELWPQDCAAVAVAQQVTMYEIVSMTITGYEPGAAVWAWVGPTTFSTPPGWENEYDYVLWISGLQAPVGGEATTWSMVKALYD
jgi:hypothetical protein